MNLFICMCLYVFVCILCMYICIYVCMYLYVCMCMYVCACMYLYVCMYVCKSLSEEGAAIVAFKLVVAGSFQEEGIARLLLEGHTRCLGEFVDW